MKRTVILFAVMAVSVVFSISSEATEKRLALVIGNAAYQNAPLKNPVNDARAMEKTLKSLGFTVWKGEDLSFQQMMKSVEDFGDELLKGGGVGLFYYSGHGMQHNGRNFLIPVNENITRENEIQYKSVDAGLVLAKMENARNRLNIVILDACRTSPIVRSARNPAQGLVHMDAPTGTIIAYATSPGKTASDGSGSNGLYTSELIRQMRVPGVGIEDMFKTVRKEVRVRSNGDQIPWESTSLEGSFYFADSGSIATEKPMPAQKPKYRLRSEPMTVSKDESWKVFKLKKNEKDRIPVEYIENDFKDNGDSTITDRATGLMWQKSGSDKSLTYDNTKLYIQEFNSKNFAGYTNWRLPTVDELKSLLTTNKQSDNLYINPIFDKKQKFCWTSDQQPISDVAWLINFDKCAVRYWYYSKYVYVRAVRSLK
ncbi:MAG: hypothetical protein BWK80_02540 [Desulfobacteraceae bacterium IS3]|nr:MAG: hypothetical protein BWK80_02540 [Desulfobacteraceae bacterium IS3]